MSPEIRKLTVMYIKGSFFFLLLELGVIPEGVKVKLWSGVGWEGEQKKRGAKGTIFLLAPKPPGCRKTREERQERHFKYGVDKGAEKIPMAQNIDSSLSKFR